MASPKSSIHGFFKRDSVSTLKTVCFLSLSSNLSPQLYLPSFLSNESTFSIIKLLGFPSYSHKKTAFQPEASLQHIDYTHFQIQNKLIQPRRIKRSNMRKVTQLNSSLLGLRFMR